MEMKLIMGYLIDKLDLRVDKDYQICMEIKGVYQCANPKMEIKLLSD